MSVNTLKLIRNKNSELNISEAKTAKQVYTYKLEATATAEETIVISFISSKENKTATAEAKAEALIAEVTAEEITYHKAVTAKTEEVIANIRNSAFKEAIKAEAKAKAKAEAEEAITEETKEAVDTNTEARTTEAEAITARKKSDTEVLRSCINDYFKALIIAKKEDKSITVKEALNSAFVYATAEENKVLEDIEEAIKISLPYFFNYAFYNPTLSREIKEAKATVDFKSYLKATKAEAEVTATEAEAKATVTALEVTAIAEAIRCINVATEAEVRVFFTIAKKATTAKKAIEVEYKYNDKKTLVWNKNKEATITAFKSVVSNKKLKTALNTSEEAVTALVKEAKTAEEEAINSLYKTATEAEVKEAVNNTEEAEAKATA